MSSNLLHHPIISNYAYDINSGNVINTNYNRIIKLSRYGYKKRYYKFHMYENGIKLQTPYHGFIYECSSGKIVPGGYVVDHIDNDQSNNKIENLQCITISENNRKDRIGPVRRPSIAIKAISEDKEEYIYHSYSQAKKDLGIDTSSIHRFFIGETKKSFSKTKKKWFTFEKYDGKVEKPKSTVKKNRPKGLKYKKREKGLKK